VQDTDKQVVDDFVITDKMMAILDKRSETPNHLCISEEESIRRLNAL
jgi:hypothetical protein